MFLVRTWIKEAVVLAFLIIGLVLVFYLFSSGHLIFFRTSQVFFRITAELQV